jgi:hypothetical protein
VMQMAPTPSLGSNGPAKGLHLTPWYRKARRHAQDRTTRPPRHLMVTCPCWAQKCFPVGHCHLWSPAPPHTAAQQHRNASIRGHAAARRGLNDPMEPPQVVVGPKRVDPLRSGLLFGQGAPSPAGQAQAHLQEPASGGGGAFRSPARRCGPRLSHLPRQVPADTCSR